MLEKYNLFIRDTYISHFKFIIDSEFNSLFNKLKKQDAIIPIIFCDYLSFVGFIKLLEIDGYKTINKSKVISFISIGKQVIEITNSNKESIKLEININNKLYEFLWKYKFVVYVKHIYEHYDWWFVNNQKLLNLYDDLINLIIKSEKINSNKILKIIESLKIYKDKYDSNFLKEYIDLSTNSYISYHFKLNEMIDIFLKNILGNDNLVKNIKNKLNLDLSKQNWFFEYILTAKNNI